MVKFLVFGFGSYSQFLIILSKSTINWDTEKNIISYERSWKNLFIGKIVGNIDWNFNHQKLKNPETNRQTWYVIEKILIIMTYHKPLKSSWKVLFNDNFFWKQGLKLYQQKPETHLKNALFQRKFSISSEVLFIIGIFLKKAIQWKLFRKHWLKILQSKTSKIVKIIENQPKYWILPFLWSKYPEHEISVLGFKNYKY